MCQIIYICFVTFRIEREQGIYGMVNVLWGIVNATTKVPIPAGQDFYNTTGMLTFQDLQREAKIEVTAIPDGIPEYQENFMLKLNKVTGQHNPPALQTWFHYKVTGQHNPPCFANMVPL